MEPYTRAVASPLCLALSAFSTDKLRRFRTLHGRKELVLLNLLQILLTSLRCMWMLVSDEIFIFLKRVMNDSTRDTRNIIKCKISWKNYVFCKFQIYRTRYCFLFLKHMKLLDMNKLVQFKCNLYTQRRSTANKTRSLSIISTVDNFNLGFPSMD